MKILIINKNENIYHAIRQVRTNILKISNNPIRLAYIKNQTTPTHFLIG